MSGRRIALGLVVAAIVIVAVVAGLMYGPGFVKNLQGQQQATTTTETPPVVASEPPEQGPTEEEIAAVPEGVHLIPPDDARYANDASEWEEFCAHCSKYGGTPYTAAKWNAKGIQPQLREGQLHCVWE